MKKPCNLTEFSRLARSREAEGELSTIRQLIELSILLPFFGVGPGFYQMAGFWKKDMPWADKKRHLSASAYRKIVEKLNPMPYRKISQNKLSETAVFRLFHVPSPEYLGYYNNLAGQDASGNELRSANNLESFLSHFRDQTKICFKPLEGWAGQGFEAVEIRKSENAISLFRFKTQRLMNPEEFKSEIIDNCSLSGTTSHTRCF
jgi:hypothetical protein